MDNDAAIETNQPDVAEQTSLDGRLGCLEHPCRVSLEAVAVVVPFRPWWVHVVDVFTFFTNLSI